MPFKNRVRIPMYISKAQFPTERNVFRKADGSTQVLSAIVRNTYKGLTDYLPEDWHRKLVIALNHDEVTIEGTTLTTNVAMDSEYEIEWPDFKNYPVAQGGFTVQSTPFNATNSNCQTCEEVSQLSLVDDTFPDPLEESLPYEIDVTGNDSICCYPATLSISWYNTLYVTGVIISQDGQVSFTTLASFPDGTNVKLVTYRATCPDGAYDEADVYADMDGTAVGCNCPSNLIFSAITDTTATVSWTAAVPAPTNYIWNLYDSANLLTPLQSGVTGSPVNLTGLVPDFDYTFQVQSNCSGVTSDCVLTGDFTTTGTNETCAEFTVSFIDGGPLVVEQYSYLDCNGVIQTENILNGSIPVSKCMFITVGATVPYYFSATDPDITYNYEGLC